jgi:hypothetical protein
MGTIFLTSPTEKINTNDTIRITMEFPNSVTNMNLKFNDEGIFVSKWGTLGISYDLTDSLISTAKYDLSLQEKNNTLHNLFFLPDNDIEAIVKLYVNSVLEFEGNIIPDTIEYDEGTKEVKFSCAPKMDILNTLKLTDDTGGLYNPAGFQTYGVEPFPSILLKIFQKVDSSISTVDIKSDWNFSTDPNISHPLFDIKSSELKFHADICVTTGLADAAGCSSLADYLKLLCISFASISGMLSAQKPFFKKMIFNTGNERQSAGIILSKHTFYKTQKYEYVKVTAYGTNSAQSVEGAGDASLSQISGQSLELKLWGMFFDYDPPGDSHFLLANVQRGGSSDGLKEIFGVSDPNLNGGQIYTSMNKFLADFWYNIRHKTQNLQFVKGNMFGINYNFIKDLVLDDGTILLLTELVKDYTNSSTTFEGINIGKVS